MHIHNTRHKERSTMGRADRYSGPLWWLGACRTVPHYGHCCIITVPVASSANRLCIHLSYGEQVIRTGIVLNFCTDRRKREVRAAVLHNLPFVNLSARFSVIHVSITVTTLGSWVRIREGACMYLCIGTGLTMDGSQTRRVLVKTEHSVEYVCCHVVQHRTNKQNTFLLALFEDHRWM